MDRRLGFLSEYVTKKKKKKKTCNIFLKTELTVHQPGMRECGRLPKTRTMREIGSLAKNRKLLNIGSVRIIASFLEIVRLQIIRNLRLKRSESYVRYAGHTAHTEADAIAPESIACDTLAREELFRRPLWGTPTPVECPTPSPPSDPSQILQGQGPICAFHLALRRHPDV